MNNPENKQNDWLGATNKILAIFLIVAAIHVLIIIIFVWLNVWRLRPGDGQSQKTEGIKEKVLPGNENVKTPNMGTTSTSLSDSEVLSRLKQNSHNPESRALP